MSTKKASHPAYVALVESLEPDYGNLTTGSMFGMPCVKHNGKARFGAYDGGVVFKLDGTAHGQALALAGSVLFDPSGKGRPMKAWVVVKPDHQASWFALAKAALEMAP
ncbi:MAG: hypothetical protein AB8H79_03695 [Myxococcota bacterium]